MTNGHISSDKPPEVLEESKQRKEAGVPNNAEQKLSGSRRGAGADTPSGPNTDRTGKRAREEIHESVNNEDGKSLSTEPRV